MAKSPLEQLPVLPLRDMVVYPHGVHPLFVGTESSIRALEAAMADSKKIFLIAKRDRIRPTWTLKTYTPWEPSRRYYNC